MPRGAGKRAIMWVGLWIALCPQCALAQGSPRVLYHKSRSFRIPVTIQQDARAQVREVRLWVSDDQGYDWKDLARTTPDRPEFPFRAPRDGEYWFAVQTLDIQGRVFPSDDRPVEPSLKVIVDTSPPVLVLEPRGRRGSRVAVSWEMQDANLLATSFVLEYQAEGARADDWRSVPLRSDELAASGSRIWEAGTADAIRVRGSVKDRAGNVRQAELMIADGLAQVPSRVDGGEAPRPISPISRSNQAQDDDPFESVSPGRAEEDPFAEPAPARDQSEPPDRASEPPPSAPTLLVGSPQCALKYAVEDSGGSGPALVELWVTRDGGRTWSRQPPDEDRTSPYQLDLGGEGTYGLWLVVQGASGLGDAPPGPGDRPQMWVEVDSTAPSLQLDPPQVGTGRSIGMVLITWKANDAHLAEKPVQLSYRPDTPDADWQPLTERIANTGRYVWKVPPGTPPRFHLRVEALDTLGNRASAETTDFGPPVIVDRSRPRGRILGLDTNSQSRLGVDDRTRQ